MPTLRIVGKPAVVFISNICASNYHCVPSELEISKVFNQDPYVIVKHTRPVDSNVLITVSPDAMIMFATIFPAINGGKSLSAEELVAGVFSQNTVSKELFDMVAFASACDIAQSKNVIVYSTQVAIGKTPVHGSDAKINLFFEIPSDKVQEDSNSKNDFRNINKYINARKDQLLLRITQNTHGTSGMTVTDKVVPATSGKNIEVLLGTGVRTNQTRTEYYADVDGYITFSAKRISVTPSIEISGNVDFSVGNIDFVGDVLIEGDVWPGFTVKGKNIVVGGVCQDASLEAEESITIKGGARGTGGNDVITSGGDITIGYCENYQLNARKDITITKYAFNSIINAGRSVIAELKTTVAGGKITAFEGCTLYNIGTLSNTNIEIIVGRKYDADAKLIQIYDEERRLKQSLMKIDALLRTVDMRNPRIAANPKMQELVTTKEMIAKRIVLFDNRIASIRSEANFANPTIAVHGEVQHGIRLRFHDVPYTVHDNHKRIKFYFNNDLHMVNYDIIPA